MSDDGEDPDRWLADQRVQDAIAERRRRHWLGRQAADSATFAGVLRDLAERGTKVAVRGPARQERHGHLRAVARDFVIVEHDDATLTFMRIDAVAAMRPLGETAVSLGDRDAAAGQELAEAIAALAESRPRVGVVTRDGTVLAGELREVGRDVVVLQADGRQGAVLYVPLASIAEVSLAGPDLA